MTVKALRPNRSVDSVTLALRIHHAKRREVRKGAFCATPSRVLDRSELPPSNRDVCASGYRATKALALNYRLPL